MDALGDTVLSSRISAAEPLGRDFYARDTVGVAKALLGKILVRELGGRILAGRIVEVEAYRGGDDPASHAYRGPTDRNMVMFGEAGHAYVYFTYGNHYCLNVVTERVGVAGAVLIRALEPICGIDVMVERRKTRRLETLTSGPGRLTQALGITLAENGLDLTLGRGLYLVAWAGEGAFDIVASRRIGIRSGLDRLWRFYVKGSRFVSKP